MDEKILVGEALVGPLYLVRAKKLVEFLFS